MVSRAEIDGTSLTDDERACAQTVLDVAYASHTSPTHLPDLTQVSLTVPAAL